MIRNDTYALFKGKEYRLISDGENNYKILSIDRVELANGFTEIKSGRYIKKITLDQLESAYSVSTYCKYKGYEFQVLSHLEEDDSYEIVYVTTVQPIQVEQLGFIFAERGVYRKRVKKVELESIYEVKTPILGFK